jgi:aspartyl-tRNA(Asn)/glutamyl-tRNA(Gln) amidotransferase subunit C
MQRRMLAFAMPAELTRSQVEDVAALAQLDLDAAELELFARQLADILEYAAAVQTFDTSGVPPTEAIAGQAADRPDDVRPSLERPDAPGNAPDPAPVGLFKVPRVIG